MKKSAVKNYIIYTLIILAQVLTGCKTGQITELQHLERSVVKEIPFRVDSIRWLAAGDFPTFKFANAEYVDASPDAEIRPDGDY